MSLDKTSVRKRLEASTADQIVKFILAVIHGYTVMARDPDLSEDNRALLNNRVHYLVGHAQALMLGESITELRQDAIIEHSPIGMPFSERALKELASPD